MNKRGSNYDWLGKLCVFFFIPFLRKSPNDILWLLDCATPLRSPASVTKSLWEFVSARSGEIKRISWWQKTIFLCIRIKKLLMYFELFSFHTSTCIILLLHDEQLNERHYHSQCVCSFVRVFFRVFFKFFFWYSPAL